jgi:RNA polymerase sigma-70 factor (ECF subfamily)
VSQSHQPFAASRVVSEDGDDAAIVARCLEGDIQAFGTLVERYQRVLYNLSLRMTGSPEDARDASQTAFLKAWEKLASFDPQYRFFSWIYRIAVNECLNQLNRRRRVEPLDSHLELPSGEDASSTLRAREASERVQAALLRLTPEHREVVILRHFLEMPYGEIADTLTIPEKTVKSRLYEARQRLCELLPEGAA